MQVIEDQKVLIKDIVAFEKIIKLIENAEEMLLADIIMINILYNVREMFEVYPFDHIKGEYAKIKKTHQRFEICIDLLEKYFRFPVQVLYVRKFLKPRVKVAAERLMKDTINYMINITMSMDKLNGSLKLKMSESLNAIQVVAGYPDELIDEKYLTEKLFNNLKVTGNEELFELYREIKTNDQKMKNQWRIDDEKKKVMKLLNYNNVCFFFRDYVTLCKINSIVSLKDRSLMTNFSFQTVHQKHYNIQYIIQIVQITTMLPDSCLMSPLVFFV